MSWEEFKGRVHRWWRQNIFHHLNPQQKWLSDKLGKRWCDKDWLLETCVFESMIHFWENEEGERLLRWQYESIEAPCGSKAADPRHQARYEEARRVYFHLDKCYRWACVRNIAWEEFHRQGYNETYNEREAELTLQDTLFMQEIISFRKWMWT